MAGTLLPFDWVKMTVMPARSRKCYITPAFSGVPIKGDKIRSGYVTPAFPGAQKWAEVIHNPRVLGGRIKGDKIRSGYFTPALSGAHEWAELLHNACILGGSHQRGQNQKGQLWF